MNMEMLNAACEKVIAALPAASPACALVLGSGWGGVVEQLPVAARMDYADIPGLGATRIEGHDGQLLVVDWEGIQVAVFQGRRHWYEGLGWEPVALPVLLSKRLGAEILLLTNAAGGIREDLGVGRLMLIDDHINAMPANPLIGAPHPELGAVFPDQSEVYDRRLRELLVQAAGPAGVELAQGVYLATPGPMYETPAEVAAFRAMGADAVGMSTVPEATVGSALGLRVAGISCITNRAAGAGGERLSHAKVIEVTRLATRAMRTVLDGFFRLLGAE